MTHLETVEERQQRRTPIMGRMSIVALLVFLPATAPAAEPPVREPTVTTLVGRHQGWVGGLIVDQLGYLYVADFQETVWRVDPYRAEVEPWARGLYGASGNTFDASGNLYQASFYGGSVSRIERGGESTVVISEGLDGPVGMVFGASGELYVCSCNDRTIKKAEKDGEVTTFATSEHFVCPNGITRDDDGNLYVVSFSNPKVVKVTPEGEASVFADSGGKGLGHITRLRGVFYATSYWDNKVYRITADGEVTLLAGTGVRGEKDGPGRTAEFSNPNGIHPDETGTYLYVNDYVGDPSAVGTARTPFSVRRIEIPNLSRILEHELSSGSLEGAKAVYRTLLSEPSHAAQDWHLELDALGWTFMMRDQIAEAAAVFELNLESNPDWWKAHGSLGAAKLELGENARAVEMLKKSLELNPKNVAAKQQLRRLGVGE